MTKEEIKAKIAEITKENTTEVLHADILTALLDMIPEGGGSDNILDLSHCTEFDKEGTKEEVAMYLGITTEQIDAVFEKKYIAVKMHPQFGGNSQYAFSSCVQANPGVDVAFYMPAFNFNDEVYIMVAYVEFSEDNGVYTINGGEY